MNILCAEIRDVPLNKPEILPREYEQNRKKKKKEFKILKSINILLIALAQWKRFRWLEWAVKRGIWTNSNADIITEVKLICGMTKLDTVDTTYVPSTKRMEVSIKKNAKKSKKQSSKGSKLTLLKNVMIL